MDLNGALSFDVVEIGPDRDDDRVLGDPKMYII